MDYVRGVNAQRPSPFILFGPSTLWMMEEFVNVTFSSNQRIHKLSEWTYQPAESLGY